jgi:hypothetical protein
MKNLIDIEIIRDKIKNSDNLYTLRKNYDRQLLANLNIFFQKNNYRSFNMHNVDDLMTTFLSKLENELETIDGSILRNFLYSDIKMLIKYFIGLTKDNNPFISIRTIDENYFKSDGGINVSRDWHIDNTAFTLACNYSGKGMEWMNNSDVNRDLFVESKSYIHGNPSVSKKLEIMKVNALDVVLLKGELREIEDLRSQEFLRDVLRYKDGTYYNTGNGLVHRGPGFDKGDTPRLLITISSFKKP